LLTPNTIKHSRLWNSRLEYLFLSLLVLSQSTTHALVNATKVKDDQWRSVAYLDLINPDTGLQTNCTAVIISPKMAVTTASCVIHEETVRQVNSVKVCIGNSRPFTGKDEHCFKSNKIYVHHRYLSESKSRSANNLAYIEFDSSIDLKKYKLSPAIPITPDELSSLAFDELFTKIQWVGFDAKNLRSFPDGSKYTTTISDVEFDYYNQTISVTSSRTRPGRNYQGIASFIEIRPNDWRFLGLVSNSHPDNITRYYPEFNPCDEDPIPVYYPEPILRVLTEVTAFPIAACGMQGFVDSKGFSPSSCTRLKKNLSLNSAMDDHRASALRQKAIATYQSNTSQNESGSIYRLLAEASDSGDDLATLSLAKYLIAGDLFTQDLPQAKEYIKQLVDNNYAEAFLLRAELNLFTLNSKRKTTQTFQSVADNIKASTVENDRAIYLDLKTAALAGHSQAQYLMGRLTQLSIGIDNKLKSNRKSREKQAYRWHALAAMQGHAASQFQLGMIWLDGRGVRKYPEVGQFWIDQSAALGNIDAQNFLGLLKP